MALAKTEFGQFDVSVCGWVVQNAVFMVCVWPPPGPPVRKSIRVFACLLCVMFVRLFGGCWGVGFTVGAGFTCGCWFHVWAVPGPPLRRTPSALPPPISLFLRSLDVFSVEWWAFQNRGPTQIALGRGSREAQKCKKNEIGGRGERRAKFWPTLRGPSI